MPSRLTFASSGRRRDGFALAVPAAAAAMQPTLQEGRGSCARASVSESAPAAPGDDDQAHHPQGVPTVKTRRAQIRPAAAITWRRASQLAQAFPRGPQTLVITPFSVSSVMARVTRFRRCLAHGSRAAAALRRTRAVGGPLLFVGPKGCTRLGWPPVRQSAPAPAGLGCARGCARGRAPAGTRDARCTRVRCRRGGSGAPGAFTRACGS